MNSKIQLWDNNRILKQITLCQSMLSGQHRNPSEELFPLEDILMEFYRDAEIGIDFHSMDNLSRLYQGYCKEQGNLLFSLAQLIEEGWLSVIFGRWESALVREKEFDGEDLTEYPDEEVLRFLVWLKEQEKKCLPAVKVKCPKDVLEKWRLVCPDTPEISWFLDKHFLVCIEEGYYAANGYTWNIVIDHAMAKLWSVWGEGEFDRWLSVARCVNATYHVLDFLEYDSQRALLKCLREDCFCKYEVPVWQTEDRFFVKTRLLERKEYIKSPEKYKNTGLWTGIRAMDVIRYDSYGFEHYRWLYTQIHDCNLFFWAVVEYLNHISNTVSDAVGEKLRAYDRIGKWYEIGSLDAEIIYELLTNGTTLFIGFRYLVKNLRGYSEYGEFYVENVIDIVDILLEEGSRTRGFLQAEEIGSCLLYLLELTSRSVRKQPEDIYEILLKRMIQAVGKEEYLSQISDGMVDYFEALLKLEAAVDWTRGYHLLLLCMDVWFYQDVRMQKLPLFLSLRNILWKGYGMIFNGECEYAIYLKPEYFTPKICFDLYESYIANESIAKRRAFLLPIDKKCYQDEKRVIPYQYKLLLRILYWIYEEGQHRDEVVKSALIEALEQVLIEQEHVFDFASVQIYSLEDVLQKCIGVLSSEDNTAAALIAKMQKADVPELLLYYHLVEDEVLKQKFLRKINENADEDSLDVFHDERAIDLVMDEQLVSLYPAAQKNLERKLKVWKQRGISGKEYFVEYAIHQQCRLQYIQGKYDEILKGENTFFKAIVYMEVENYKDFQKADTLWKEMISHRKQKNYASSVFMNYLVLLNREWAEADREDEDNIAYLEKQTDWIINIIEQEEIEKWGKETKEEYCYLVIQNRKLQGKEFLQGLYTYNSRYQLSLSARNFIDEPQDRSEVQISKADLNYTDEDFVNIISRFQNMDQERKSKIYYASRGIQGKGAMSEALLVDKVLGVCEVLRNYGPRLVLAVEKRGQAVRYKLYENYVTQLFREVFNLAYGEWYDLTIHDQQESASTGHIYGGHKSPAKLDLVVFRNHKQKEILEAFVLEEKTDRKVFKDHIGKVVGNNNCHVPLSFMLVYGNARDNDKVWKKYQRYLEHELKEDIMDTMIIDSRLQEITEAPYYVEKIMMNYTEFKFLRQIITFEDKTEQEILHIFIDIAQNQESELRNTMSKG